MKKTMTAMLASAAVLTLSACGSSDKASEEAQAENVEMPAEEAMGDVDASAAPVADASAAPGADASASAPASGEPAAVEKATADAEKKM
ncbi:MAG: hypothetical protein AB7F98_12250 [Novosphingobium sp.]